MSELVAVGPELWLAQGEVVDFHGFPYDTRMLAARLGSGDVWLWSPVRPTDALAREIGALGPVRHLVSPNSIHHLFLGHWQERFPEARLWGLPAVIRKRPELAFEPPLGDEPPRAWAGEIDQVVFRGSFFLDEIVFFHRASRTAIFGDLTQRFSDSWLRAHWKPWQRWIARRWGITDGRAPLEWRASWLRRAPARAALRTVLAWDPERVVMAHGERPSSGARAYLERAFDWLA